MYSEKLQKLIKGALADGRLEEREIKVLRRVAEEEGLDPDEIQMEVEGMLASQQQPIPNRPASAPAPTTPSAVPTPNQGTPPIPPTPNAGTPPVPPAHNAAPAPSTEKIGNIKKCPQCGAVLTGVEATCPECGHIFTGVKANRNISSFSEAICRLKGQDLSKFITGFPVPNSAEDLMEFTLTLYTCYKANNDAAAADAFKAKLRECQQKIELLFPNDERMKRVLDKTKLTLWDNIPETAKIFGSLGAIFIFLLFLLYIVDALGL